MRVILSAYIEQDLAAIADYIAKDAPMRAVTFILELRTVFERIGRNPSLFRARPDIGHGIRRVIHGQYLIIFHLNAEDITILRVIHGARDISKLQI